MSEGEEVSALIIVVHYSVGLITVVGRRSIVVSALDASTGVKCGPDRKLGPQVRVYPGPQFHRSAFYPRPHENDQNIPLSG